MNDEQRIEPTVDLTPRISGPDKMESNGFLIQMSILKVPLRKAAMQPLFFNMKESSLGQFSIPMSRTAIRSRLPGERNELQYREIDDFTMRSGTIG